MSTVGLSYTSATWTVKPGHEEEFVRRWTEFTEWAHANSRGAQSFVLLRSNGEPQQYTSFGAWESPDAVAAWRNTPEFAQHLARCREVCDDFRPNDQTVVAAVGT